MSPALVPTSALENTGDPVPCPLRATEGLVCDWGREARQEQLVPNLPRHYTLQSLLSSHFRACCQAVPASLLQNFMPEETKRL